MLIMKYVLSIILSKKTALSMVLGYVCVCVCVCLCVCVSVCVLPSTQLHSNEILGLHTLL